MTTLQHAEPFADLQSTPESHFRLYLLSSIYRVLHFLSLMEARDGALVSRLRAEPVIVDHLSEAVAQVPPQLTWQQGADWWERAIHHLEQRSTTDLPLAALKRTCGLDETSMIAFMLAGLVEEESRFGAVFSGLQTSTDARRPTVELAGKIARGERLDLDPWTICRPLFTSGILRPVESDAPRAERALVVAEACWDAARGQPPSDIILEPGVTPDQFGQFGIGPDLGATIGRIPRLIQEGRIRSVIIRGTPGSDRVVAARAIAGTLGRSALIVPKAIDAVAPLATMLNAVPVRTIDLTSGENAEASIDVTPTLFVMGPDGGLTGDIEPSVTLTLDALTPSERRAHWTRSLGTGVKAAEFDRIVDRFIIPPLYIRRAAGIAQATAGIDGRDSVTCEDVRIACRSLGRRHLETHTDRLETYGSWHDLVVTAGTRSRLSQLEQFCRHRERVLDLLTPAYGRPANRGVRALFSGPSGTGKTFAARILAAELGRDLYRLDLGATVSKYIGETEKNLHHVFSIAEELDVVLLLDEGDSLLGGRTDVRSANDRYANLETNYLLQRLEHYQGIVLVTTNLGDNIDPAFERRMDVVAEFLPPAAEERLHIWRLHLAGAVDESFLAQIAGRCELTGGQIRNAAKQAALLALDDGRPLGADHITAAAHIEFLKAGAASPLLEQDRPRRRARNVESVLGQGRSS